MPVHQTIIPPLEADPDPAEHPAGTLFNVAGALKVVNEAQDGFDEVGGGGGSPPVISAVEMTSPEAFDSVAWIEAPLQHWAPEGSAPNKALAHRYFGSGDDTTVAFTISASEFPEGWEYYGLKLLVVDLNSGTISRDIIIRYGGGGGGYSGDQNAITLETVNNGPQAEEVDLGISIGVPAAGGYSVVEIIAEQSIVGSDFGVAKALLYKSDTAPNPDP